MFFFKYSYVFNTISGLELAQLHPGKNKFLVLLFEKDFENIGEKLLI